MKQFLYFLATICIYGIAMGQEKVADPEFDQMLQKLLSHDVSEISVFEAGKDSSAIYLDAHEKPEFEVSHIKNALWVGYDNFNLLRLKNIPKDSKIIVYCSVGYRSEKIAKKLEKKGFTNVSNLYGGIFEWKHQNQTVFKNQKETDSIHTYDKQWSKWLFNGIKVY